ncbi:hypothetical protein QF028_002719 [Neobacillus sp. B4I6]|uniref:hypothetical protein n=1 Tax=Neobacillus sp. B4I6 TaxID=3373925 RepID=UPI003D1CBC08
MKKLLAVLFMSLVLIVSTIAPFGTTTASAASNGTATYTLPYGKRTIENFYTKAANFGYAPLKINTEITIGTTGVTINKVTQSSSDYWPYYTTKKGTRIVTKSSSKSTQTAHTLGNFDVYYMKGVNIKYNPIKYVSRTAWELHTYITVKSINTTKKTVTFTVANTAGSTF